MLNQPPFNVSFSAEENCLNACFSVLLLSSASFLKPSFDTSFALLRSSQPANTKMLEFLVQQGADIATCHPSAWPRQLWVAHEQLIWFLRNGLSTDNASIYSFMVPEMQPLSKTCSLSRGSQGCCDKHNVQMGVVQVFSSKEVASLLHRNSETPQHPLSFFISLQPGQGILDRELESGINVNGRGGDLQNDTPLRAAARAGDHGTIQRLVSHGARVKFSDSDCELSAFQLACGGYRRDPTKLRFIEPRAGLNLGEIADSSIRDRFREVVELLLTTGANSSDRGTFGCLSPLLLATDAKITKLLLAHGADPNEYDGPKCRLNCENNGFIAYHSSYQFPRL